MLTVLPGAPHLLGANWDGEGTNFALYSENATAVELCLFDDEGHETVLPLENQIAYVWHGYVPGAGPGQRYGYRVHGPYDPAAGQRFNPAVVLLDPYAKAVDGVERWGAGCFGYELGAPEQDLKPTSAPQLGAPRGLVIDPSFDWEGDQPLRTPLHRSVIYEAHVRGLTKLHPEVPPELQGTYAGVAHPAIIRYLNDLGVTAIELMPVHAFVDDKHLLDKGLRNYWGYNSVGFFAPDVRYRASATPGGEVREFKEMVKALHRAGIEVILDVVYNHTAEGNHLGPTFSFKGIDNRTYYRLVGDGQRYYFDYTGTGNTLNVRHPQVLALIMDSLRYWASEMHVDGFRFDLASSLARQLHEVDRLSSFFTLIHQAPPLREVKLIAEPWDVGEGGYQVGNFPVRWAEWNGRFRDAVRALWRGEGGQAGEIGYRITGSSDLYETSGRRPSASVNLVTAHDGFTLRDLVSYDHKHNEANGEDNRDGNDAEHSWNCGAEGPTDDPEIRRLRARQQRNLLATLLLSQGTPMLLAGDEFGRTQRGNNNAYCQDNEVSWLDWRWSDEQRALFDLTRRLLRVRRQHPALHRSKFFQGRAIHGTELQDLLWFRFDGQPMSAEDWQNPGTQSLVMFLAGRGIDDVDEEGRPVVDDNLLLMLNASPLDLEFELPKLESVPESWHLLLDTASDHAEESLAPGDKTRLVSRSLKFFRAPARVFRTGGARHTLGATYRMQLSAAFQFDAAAAAAGYLAELGVTDAYVSPIMAATPGSSHGYDVVDHSRLNPELGGAAGFEAFTDRLRRLNLGLLVDWVPNHMGIASEHNRWWHDVLENGPSSAYADHFDIDWTPPKQALHDRILLPILADQYGEVLERGDLKMVWTGERLELAYFERRLPLGPRTWTPVLEELLQRLEAGEDDETRQELESITTALHYLPSRDETAPERRRERSRDKKFVSRRLAELFRKEPRLQTLLEQVLTEFNGTPGSPGSFDRLDAVLQAQGYRLASWQVAADEINYRRFFDINDLAAIKMELPAVFEQAHALLFELLDSDRIQALRLDHTDGLWDPDAYFEALQRRFGHWWGDRASSVSSDDRARPLPILVEKILEAGERLPESWPVDGTTGYDFSSAVLGLWVNPQAEKVLTGLYRSFTGDTLPFEEHVYQSKQHILRFSLASEIKMLAQTLERIASSNRKWRDFTLASLTQALTETLAAFGVYRTYFRMGLPGSEQDEARIRHAVSVARAKNPLLGRTVFSFLEDTLAARSEQGERGEDRRRLALRFQQLTGPVTAKAVEDTAFYRYHRLVCLNDVGGVPSKFGTTVEEFHKQNADRARTWPLSMITTATHDSKRGEDAGARIAVLSEIPMSWRRTVQRWSDTASSAKSLVDDAQAPSAGHEYLFYQALVGAWPVSWDGREGREEFRDRLKAYLIKAAKEGKLHTSWTNPNVSYDRALARFVDTLLADDRFMHDVAAFCSDIDIAGATNSLAATLLKLCSPGVPDIYQGSELWNQSLVDPDNRRPVDYELRRALLARIRRGLDDRRKLVEELLADPRDGAVKLYVCHVALEARKRHRDLFLFGDYEPLLDVEHVVAFTRTQGARRLICCVPQHTARLFGERASWPLGAAWGDRTLRVPYAGTYANLLTGTSIEVTDTIHLAELFRDFPVALLLRTSGGG